jgi:glycosyltransferase involved in cell wall biosynthesis
VKAKTSLPQFSVVMSVYSQDVPEYLEAAIASILNQTLPPSEVILVEDGPIPEPLSLVVSKWVAGCPRLFRVVSLPKNLGLGGALGIGLQECSHEIVARMDADDISIPQRFEKQYGFLVNHPEIDAISSWTGFFLDWPENIVQIERKPETHEDLRNLALFRTPLPHAPVMYRRSSVLRAGNYSAAWSGVEDYHLWVRMLLSGCKFHCLQEVLYKVRISKAFFRRRKGLRRAVLQVRLQNEFRKMGFISEGCFLRNCAARILLCTLPNPITQALRSRFT